MGREHMAEIEAFCFEMTMIYFKDLTFIINRDLSRKAYDENYPIVQDISSMSKDQTGKDKELTILEAVQMGNDRVESMESRIADYKKARDAMLSAMGIEMPTIGRRYEVGRDDFLYFVVVDGDRNSTRRNFSSRNLAEIQAGKLAKAYARTHGQTATYREHPEASGRCWVVE